LTHVELRFARLLKQLTALPVYLQKQSQHLQNQTRQLQAAQLDMQQVQTEARHLQQQLKNFELAEEEYLILLKGSQEELEQAQQKARLYEAELEQLVLHHDQAGESREQENTQHAHQAQDMGRSLARLVGERNALTRNYLELQSAHEALQLQCAQQESQLQAQQEQLQSKPLSEAFLRRLHYTLSSETAAALGQPLRVTQKYALAQSLQLSPQEQALLDQQPLKGHIYATLSAETVANTGGILLSEHDENVEALSAWVKIPSGIYTLGDAMHPAERPEHRVSLAAFEMGRFPVTNAEFAEFMAAGAYQKPEYWFPEGWKHRQEQSWHQPAFWGEASYHSGLDFPQHPVVGVCWYEAMAYARWAGGRLPTEAEWEAAARGATGLIWPWGNQWQSDCANTAETQHLSTTPVGLYPLGATPTGLLDLIGNVFEWTASVYQAYPYQPEHHEPATGGVIERSLRGCSFNHKGSYFSRAAYRFHSGPFTRHSDIGFRMARA
jgi:formylglycine-generating enzyme required for sulfatase activity